MAIKILKHNKLSWHLIDDLDAETVDFLKNNFRFHPLDIKDVTGGGQNPKIDVYNNYIFLIVYYPEISQDRKSMETIEVNIFFGDDYIVTVQKGKSRFIKNLFYRIQGNNRLKSEYFSQNSGLAVYWILESLYKYTNQSLNYLSQEIVSLENFVYGEQKTKEVITQLTQIRRQIVNLKRIFDPQRYIINTLTRTKKVFLPVALNVYFDDVDDMAERVSVVLDNYKETVNNLFEVSDALISYRTNEVIKVLTIFSVSMLPLTLLSGIYGMNIDSLPFAHHPQSVGVIFALLALIITLILITLRKRNWL